MKVSWRYFAGFIAGGLVGGGLLQIWLATSCADRD